MSSEPNKKKKNRNNEIKKLKKKRKRFKLFTHFWLVTIQNNNVFVVYVIKELIIGNNNQRNFKPRNYGLRH